jgi:hypothetical protein
VSRRVSMRVVRLLRRTLADLCAFSPAEIKTRGQDDTCGAVRLASGRRRRGPPRSVVGADRGEVPRSSATGPQGCAASGPVANPGLVPAEGGPDAFRRRPREGRRPSAGSRGGSPDAYRQLSHGLLGSRRQPRGRSPTPRGRSAMGPMCSRSSWPNVSPIHAETSAATAQRRRDADEAVIGGWRDAHEGGPRRGPG